MRQKEEAGVVIEHGVKSKHFRQCCQSGQVAGCPMLHSVAKHMPEVIFYLLAQFASVLIY